MLVDILNVVVYVVIGQILMQFGSFCVDLAIPCDFPEEIKKGNKAVGFIMAGAFIAIGIIVKSAVMTMTVAEVKETLAEGITSTVIYSLVGIILCVLGYLVTLLFNRRYNLNEEVGKGNAAAGIMIMGMFIGLGTIISGVIM